MEVIDVVRKLIGPIDPYAESAIDAKRFENLKEMCLLANKILFDINQVANHSESGFASVKKAGEYAQKFLNDIKEQ
jgi:hypothetical protein